MIKLSDKSDCLNVQRWVLTIVLALSLVLSGMLGLATEEVSAAADNVTLKYGTTLIYGNLISGFTTVKWVTHVDGKELDLDDEPGVSRSYAYCVQPKETAPPAGTYKVTLVDDDDSGKISKMRKLIYYLPGSYGYTKVTKKRWFSGKNVEDAYIIDRKSVV